MGEITRTFVSEFSFISEPVATFSNAARRRFLKSKQIENINPTGNYIQRIRQARGKSGSINTPSPILNSLQDNNMIQDPADLSYIQGGIDRLVSKGTPALAEESFSAYRRGQAGIVPTQKQANAQWDSGFGAGNSGAVTPYLPKDAKDYIQGLGPAPTNIRGKVEAHTHPLGSAAIPSAQDLNYARASDVMGNVQNPGQNPSYVLRYQSPNRLKATQYQPNYTDIADRGTDYLDSLEWSKLVNKDIQGTILRHPAQAVKMARTESGMPRTFYDLARDKNSDRFLSKVENKAISRLNQGFPNYRIQELGYMDAP